MHHKVYEQQKVEREKEKDKKREENKKKIDKAKAKSKKKKELKEPPMKMIANLLGGLKLEIKRVHFRYEDDYFQHHKPFAFGLMIESIIMDNADTDWIFESLLSMNFTRNQPVNPKTTNKELNIKNVKFYWNSMSEMFVPTSLWQQTRHLQYQIFEAMDANFLKEIMTDAFSEDQQKLPYTYLIQPFTIYTQINLNPSQGVNDPYKYQINTLISCINANVHPHMVRDILKFQQFLEMFSYAKDLKKFRPLLKVQTFIDQQAYTPQQKKKRHAVIRDWFQLVLWYVRLRKVSKGFIPYKLLEVESQYQQQNLQNALLKVKRANLMAYEHYQGSSDEDEFTDPNKINSTRTEDLDAISQYEKQKFDIHNTKVLRDMFTGFKFALRLEGIKAKVFTKKKIIKAHQNLPRLELNLDMLTISAGLQGHNLLAKVLLKEIRLVDYFKREPLKTFSRQANNISRQIPNRDSSYTRSQAQLENAQPRGTLASMVKNVFNGTSSYNTPDKGGRSITDIIYGGSQQNDRSVANSRQVPYDYFAFDLPDPSMAHNKTRETLTISDVLNNSNPSSRPTSVQNNGSRGTNRNNFSMVNQNLYTDNYQMTTPSRASKIVKAQKFQQSPTKGLERKNVMNNLYLNQRSETFVDDQLDSVDKRCFFLMCGKSPNIDAFLTIDIQANIFDEPGLKKKVNLNLCVDQIIIEYCNDIMKSLTDLGIQYKLAFNYADMKPAKGPTKKNKKRGLQTSIQYYAPLYVLKKQILKRAFNVKEEAILNYQKQWYIQKEKAKSKNDIMKEAREKQFKTIMKIKDIDKKLSDVNFDVGVVLKNIYLGITGDKDDHFVSNQTLLEFGIENQGVYLTKQDFKCKVSVFGISVSTLNSFEMLFIFANNMKKVVATYGENIAILTSVMAYKDFIKNIKKNLEKEDQQKQIEEQRELFKKASQPQIVVIGNESSRGSNKKNQQQHQRMGSGENLSKFNISKNEQMNLRQPQVQVNKHVNFNKDIHVNDNNNDNNSNRFQAERNMIQNQNKVNFSNNQPTTQGRMGNNQIFLMNQNTMQSDKQQVKKNPNMHEQQDNRNARVLSGGNSKNQALMNRQQTGFNGRFQDFQESQDEEEDNDSDQQSDDQYQQNQQQPSFRGQQNSGNNNFRQNQPAQQFQQQQKPSSYQENQTKGGGSQQFQQQHQLQKQYQQQQPHTQQYDNRFSNHLMEQNNRLVQQNVGSGNMNSGRRNVQILQQESEEDNSSQNSDNDQYNNNQYGSGSQRNMGNAHHFQQQQQQQQQHHNFGSGGDMRMRGNVQAQNNAVEFNLQPRKR